MSPEERNAVSNGVSNGRSNAISNAPQTSTSVLVVKEVATEENPFMSPTAPDDVIDAAAEAELRADRAAMRLQRYLARRPARFAAPGDLHPDLLAWAQRFLAGAAGNLVITGSTGAGKSWSAWRLGEEILRRGFPGRVEVTRAYRFKRLATPPADFAEIDRLASAGLLALDDIGAVRVSDWDADHLYGAIDDRSEARRPTIITTTATAKREEGRTLLQTLLGDRVASRIAEDVTIVILDGPDRRRSS